MIQARASENHAEELLKQMKILKGNVIKVGLPENTPNYYDGTDIITVGATHEYGVPEKNIPRRSFLRVPLIKREADIKKLMQKGFNNVSKSGGAIEMMNKIGLYAQNISQMSFTSNEWTPLKPNTIKRKGSSRPLIDTGILRSSITYVVEKK
jgi:hypothetical protein